MRIQFINSYNAFLHMASKRRHIVGGDGKKLKLEINEHFKMDLDIAQRY
jgi:hypothetical protein